MLVSQVDQAVSQYLTQASVESINNGQALLKLEQTGEVVSWPVSHLPAHITPGSQVTIQFGDEKQKMQERNSIAHMVLAQLMQ